MSGRIFISYRRDDERGIVGRLLSALQSSFTPEQLFADADPVQPGDDVVRGLNSKIGQSSALVAIIGPKWLSVSDTRRTTRLDNAADVVRVAVEAAFRKRLRVVPVLIGGAEMPSAEQLPLTLRPLATLAPVRIQNDSFQADVEALVKSLKGSVGQRTLPRLFWPAIAIGVALIAVGASLFVWQGLRNPFVPSTVAERAPATSPSTASPQLQAQPKVGVDIIQDNSKTTDRIDQPGLQAPVAPRVVLYDEDPSDPQGKQYAGQVAWRTEQIAGTNGQPSDLAIRADVDVPDRKLKMTFRFRRNNDPSLPASHTVDFTFVLAPGFDGGGIDNVPGILMKTNEHARGTPLAGLAVKVTDDFFMAGLSNVNGDRARNMQLLKERSWFDIPLVYANKRRAIIAMEKGAAGERAFNDAFAAWGQ